MFDTWTEIKGRQLETNEERPDTLSPSTSTCMWSCYIMSLNRGHLIGQSRFSAHVP